MIRVMLVDDSATIRGLISRSLEQCENVEIVAKAFNGRMAIDLARQHRPDFVILDIEMPEMDGITALPQILEASPQSKVIMASTLTMRNANISLEALRLGAVDYLPKPSLSQSPTALEEFYRGLKEKIYALYDGENSPASTAPAASQPVKQISADAAGKATEKKYTLNSPNIPLPPIKALAIASSTGGPQALLTVFKAFNGYFKDIPIFLTQHMPPVFTAALADQLAKVIGRECAEGKNGEQVKPGNIYVAPGDYHMTASRKGTDVVLKLDQGPQVNFCRPAADPMFESLSAIYGKGLLALVLTGMGKDGLAGAQVIVENGGSVIAQDEATSAVWGMPGAVATHNLCRAVLPLQEIPGYIVKQTGR